MSVKGSITTADYLPYQDYKRLLQQLENERKYKWCLYCTLSFCLGLRVSDILKLRWRDIVKQNSMVVTEKKTGKTKRIEIGTSAAAKIADIYAKLQRPKLTEYVMGGKDGKPISSQYINRMLKEWIVKYNLPIKNFSTHTFRKTFGRYVYEKEGKTEESLILLNHIFKHHSIRTTIVYIGLSDEEIGRIFKGIEV